MTFEPESRNIGRPGNEPTPGAQPQSRVAKPLGRGLEDISHLFLSNCAGRTERDDGSDRASDRPAGRPTTRSVVPLRRGELLTKDQVTATLRDCPSVLDESMRVVDIRLACPPCGEIDMLVTIANQLAIIDIDLAFGDPLLLRGLSHVDWIARNARNVQRMYRALPGDFARSLRLLLIGPQFSPGMAAAVRQVPGIDIRCFRYHSVDLGSGTGIFFEQTAGEDN